MASSLATSVPEAAGERGRWREPATRIWRLQYGPCWCGVIPSESGSFDFVRLRTTVTDLGGIRDNFLIVSERVIDGSKQVFRETYDDVPDPKLVISTAVCPTATRFWDELPVGWASVGEVLPVDIAVAECINGNPESLMAAVLSHLTPRETNVSEAESNAAMSLGR